MRERTFLVRGETPDYIRGVLYDRNAYNYSYYPLRPIYYDYFKMGMIDVVTPDYKARSRAGEIVNNPMWAYTLGLKQTKMRVTSEGQCQYYVIHEPELMLPGVWTPGTMPMKDVVDTICDAHSDESSIAQVKAWANIDVSELQGLASLGELPESVKMIIDLLKSAMQLTIAMKRGDFATIAKAAKKSGFTVDGLSDLWLGYRYGIRPMISEVQSLLKAVDKELSVDSRFTARGKHKTSGDYTIKGVELKSNMVNQFDLIHTEVVSYNRVYRAGVLVMIDRGINQTAAIWGLDSPIEAAWELVPFSFIIDWFTNIGDIIGALILNPGLTPLSSWVTETISHSVTRTATGVVDYLAKDPPNCWARTTALEALDPFCKTSSWYTVKRRVPLAERYSLPSLNLNLNIAKLTDLALIARKLF